MSVSSVAQPRPVHCWPSHCDTTVSACTIAIAQADGATVLSAVRALFEEAAMGADSVLPSRWYVTTLSVHHDAVAHRLDAGHQPVRIATTARGPDSRIFAARRACQDAIDGQLIEADELDPRHDLLARLRHLRGRGRRLRRREDARQHGRRSRRRETRHAIAALAANDEKRETECRRRARGAKRGFIHGHEPFRVVLLAQGEH